MEELWRMGVEEGRQEGRQEALIENTINLLKEGTIPMEVIARCVGLPLEEVKNLQAT